MRFLYQLKLSFLIGASFLFLSISSNYVFASELLNDDFNTLSLDDNKWLILNETNQDLLNGSEITISSIDATRSAYLQNISPLNTSEGSELIIRFKYSNLSFGSGIAINNTPPVIRELNQHPSVNDWTIFVWPTSSTSFKVFSTVCPLLGPCLQSDNVLFTVVGTDSREWHILRILYENSKYTVWLDNLEGIETNTTTRDPKYIWFGNPMITGGVNFSSFAVDYVHSSNLSNNHLFPYLSQLDTRWGAKEYDSASSWAGEENDGIDSWGCALTSAAMMLQHYDIKDLEGGEVNPEKLNNWLLAEPDGYIGQGLINWIAITRYVKESFDAGLSSTKLEFSRSYPPTTPVLPAILGVPGHFIVAYDEDELSWKVNDPASESAKIIPKTSVIQSINRFVPSNTNLSYMLFAMPSFLVASLVDSSGNNIPVNWVDEYLSDDNGHATGSTLRTGMVPKLASGKYKISIKNPSSNDEKILFYLYDDLGSLTKIEKVINPGDRALFIDYFADDSGVSTIYESDVTAPDIPMVIAPISGSYVKASGLILDWSDVDDPSLPITYHYKSSWNGGSYGPVSTGSNSFINASGSADRTYTWQVQACDRYNNCSGWSNSILTIDSTKPTTPSITYPLEGAYFRNSPILNEWSQSTDRGGLDFYRVEYAYDDGHTFSGFPYRTTRESHRYHTPSIAEQGGVKFRVQAIDKALNESDWSEWRHYTYDATNPSVPTFTSTDSITNSSTQTWTWNPSLDIGGSGIAGYYNRQYSVSDNLLGEWGWLGNVLTTATSLSEGKWRMDLKAVDNAGNESEYSRSDEIVVDFTAPNSPILLTPVDGAVVNGTMLVNDWSDVDGAVSYIYESYHDEFAKKLRYHGEYLKSEKTANQVGESIFWWRVKAKDQAGNVSEWSKLSKVTVDNTPPVLQTKTKFAGWYDKPQISYFDYADENLALDYLSPWCEIKTEGLGQLCSVKQKVCDLAGNCIDENLNSNLANLDFGKPLISLDIWGRTLSGTASDRLSGIKSIILRITKPGQSEEQVNPTGLTNWSYTITDAMLGHYVVKISSMDWSGNESEIIVKEFDINPASAERRSDETAEGKSSVLGATAESQKNANQSLSKKLGVVPKDTPTPSPKIELVEDMDVEIDEEEELPTQIGNVLGEAVESNAKTNAYWWGLGIIFAILILLLSWRRISARRSRV